jgi:hypothetical protein
LVFWSSFRMVSAAMSAMIALLASDAKRLLGKIPTRKPRVLIG